MTKIITAVFDGHALQPESTLDLEPNARYVITIQGPTSPSPEGNAWDLLETLTGTIEAPRDWAGEHDHRWSGDEIASHKALLRNSR